MTKVFYFKRKYKSEYINELEIVLESMKKSLTYCVNYADCLIPFFRFKLNYNIFQFSYILIKHIKS